MTNTLLLAGPHDPEEIIRSVKRGIYATRFGGGQVDIASGDFVFSLSEAYLIEDGKLTAPVKDVNLIGNGPDALGKVTMLGTDLRVSDGIWTCGKDGQSVPVGVGCPTIKISSMTVGGTAVQKWPQEHQRMNQDKLSDLVDDVLQRLLTGGASDAKVVARAGQSLSVKVRMGETELVEEAGTQSISVRAMKGQARGDELHQRPHRRGPAPPRRRRPRALRPLPGRPLRRPPRPVRARQDLARPQPLRPGLRLGDGRRGHRRARKVEDAAREDARITNSEGATFDRTTGGFVMATSGGFAAATTAATRASPSPPSPPTRAARTARRATGRPAARSPPGGRGGRRARGRAAHGGAPRRAQGAHAGGAGGVRARRGALAPRGLRGLRDGRRGVPPVQLPPRQDGRSRWRASW
jgi:hypothetical protein